MFTLAFTKVDVWAGFQAAFVAVYTFLFAVILATFEITRVKPVVKIEQIFQQNFGFLYSHFLKGIFILLYVHCLIPDHSFFLQLIVFLAAVVILVG